MLRAGPSWFSNSRPPCSNSRFLLDAGRSTSTWSGASSLATRLMRKRAAQYTYWLAALILVVALVLVAQDLTIELVGEQVDRGIEIVFLAFAVQVLAADMQRAFGLLADLVHREDHVGVDHMVEVSRDPLELRAHVAQVGRGDIHVMAAHVEVHSQRAFRWLTAGICRLSRYFAIVRRATTIPCSPRIWEMRESESGVLLSSAATSCLMSARIAVEEAAPPVSVATWLPKKYLSSYVPRGVAMNFCVVTREMVLSCRLSVSAISRSTRGRMATSPCSRKWRCRSTMACETRRIVSKRCCTFLISQRASCSCEEMAAPLPRPPEPSCAYR